MDGVLIRFLVERIGNTADYGTSGLDEGQAAGLLSAVGEAGLSLVEPGHTTDPVAAGLKAAIRRAHHAWLETQPQLFFELWPDDGLDETHVPARPCAPGVEAAVRLVEPVISPDGLTDGAEPCRDTTTGLTALRVHRPEDSPVTALAATSAGSAPLINTTGPDAPPAEGTRPAQEVTV